VDGRRPLTEHLHQLVRLNGRRVRMRRHGATIRREGKRRIGSNPPSGCGHPRSSVRSGATASPRL
jgi:hypothetical protein